MYVIKRKNKEISFLSKFQYNLEGLNRTTFSREIENAKTFPADQKESAERLMHAINMLTNNTDELFICPVHYIFLDQNTKHYIGSFSCDSNSEGFANFELNFVSSRKDALKLTKQTSVEVLQKVLNTFPNPSRFKLILH